MPDSNSLQHSNSDGERQRHNIVMANRQARLVMFCMLVLTVITSLVAISFVTQLTARLESPAADPLDLPIKPKPTLIALDDQVFADDVEQTDRQAVEVLAAQVMSTTQPVFGPAAGKLKHRTDDVIPCDSADVTLGDFIVQATFTNPYSIKDGPWDYGFIFRNPGDSANNDYRLIINSNSIWGVELVRNVGDKRGTIFTTIAEHRIDDPHLLNTSLNGSNQVRLIVSKDWAYIYLNRIYIARVKVDQLVIGDIWAGTTIWNGDYIEGKSTSYEGFTVWRLPYR
jgi:hypothetical protein